MAGRLVLVGVIVSVNVGTPREVSWRGQTVRTAIWKDPVPGRVGSAYQDMNSAPVRIAISGWVKRLQE